MEVKFNVNTLDKDTGILYPASDDFVNVSDAFASRLKALKSKDYEFDGILKKKEDNGKIKELEADLKLSKELNKEFEKSNDALLLRVSELEAELKSHKK